MLMMVITEPHLKVSAAELAGKRRDVVRLTWEERRWGRKKLATESGREVALALPTGSVLSPGAVLLVERDWYLEVEAAPEPILAAFPRGHAEAIRLAFEVGNRHFSLAIEGDAIFVPDDPAMEQLLIRLGVPWERSAKVFVPVGFGHSHGH